MQRGSAAGRETALCPWHPLRGWLVVRALKRSLCEAHAHAHDPVLQQPESSKLIYAKQDSRTLHACHSVWLRLQRWCLMACAVAQQVRDTGCERAWPSLNSFAFRPQSMDTARLVREQSSTGLALRRLSPCSASSALQHGSCSLVLEGTPVAHSTSSSTGESTRLLQAAKTVPHGYQKRFQCF